MLKKLFSFSNLLWILIILAILFFVYEVVNVKEAYCRGFLANVKQSSECCSGKSYKNTNTNGQRECGI